MRFPLYVLLGLVLLGGMRAAADEVLPAKPEHYFNDYAHVVDAGTADSLNSELADFERQTSNQIVVAVYPKLQTDDSLDDYAYRIFQAWGIGQKKQNNGALLLVFVQDHKTRIQTGYGLEGALPDVTCEQILNNQLKPHFRQGDFAGGLKAGIDAMIAATKGEYKGDGQTVRDRQTQAQAQGGSGISLFVVFIILIVLINIFRGTRGVMYGSSGSGFYGGFGGGGFGGGGGGGGFGGGGGGFSGGGGSSGGGGASGGW